jgi:NADH:ubiquinone oxidoreductase subunit D
MLLEHVLGARLHTQFDGPVSQVPVISSSSIDNIISIAVTRLDYMLDIILLRHNIARVYGVASVDALLSIGSIYSGPMTYSAGLATDTRSECTCYSRSSISMLLAGTMSCSYVRLLIRLLHPPQPEWSHPYIAISSTSSSSPTRNTAKLST